MTDTYLVGAVVPLTFECFDSTGNLAAPLTATLTITLPDGSTVTPVLDNPDPGVYLYDFVPSTSGWHVASFVATGDAGGASTNTFNISATLASVVSLADIRAYLTDSTADDATLTSALTAERAAQARSCRVDDYGPDLREALLRRVARNLAARAVPVASYTSFDGGGTAVRVPSRDPEVRRLEAPYRRVSVG